MYSTALESLAVSLGATLRPRAKRKIYVGLFGFKDREVFFSETEPTPLETPHYSAVMGPFKTLRGAKYCAGFGAGNPHIQCVADAERIAKKNSASESNRREVLAGAREARTANPYL